MSLLSWSDRANYRHLFPAFRYRPEIENAVRGISHPVKDGDVHREICRLAQASGTAAWYHGDDGKWGPLFATDQPARILETGTGDGAVARHLLEEVFTHPLSELHGIDLAADEEDARPPAHPQADTHAGRLHLYEVISSEILAWMIAGDGFWESFDFAHLNASGDAASLLTDACQVWNLLKPGGMLMFGEKSDAGGIDAFLAAFQGRLQCYFIGGQIAVRRRVPGN